MKRSPGSLTLTDLLSWLEICVGILLILMTVFLFFGTPTQTVTTVEADGPGESESQQLVEQSPAMWLQLAIIGLVNLAGVGFLYDGIRRRGRRPA
ncbi:hypothetical protein [Halocatena halophila]|uniref:hypothetical protein n=1 Tax=Halocatena halophila TaxID=2814576 RepID=UPI002ED625D1